MKTKVEYEISEQTGHTIYYFYVRKKIDKEWCWIWGDDLYPDMRYDTSDYH